MTILRKLFFSLSLLISLPAFAFNNTCDHCCGNKGCIQYCDSSAGRFVCSNGDYSSCYCTRHAVMNLQKIQGCCLWQGGVFKIDDASHLVICNDGSVSETCSTQYLTNRISLY